MRQALLQLARRSVVRTVRNPALVAQGMIFPLFLYAFNVGGLDLATSLPGFPTESYATFALALTFAYCGIYAVTVAGTQLGEDVKTGFVRRMTLTPMSGAVLLLAQLGGVVVFAVFQAVIFLLAGLAAGARVEAGPAGALLIVGLAALFAIAFGSLGLTVALLTRSSEAVQAVFPLFMAALFFSSVGLPRELIQSDWFQQVTTYNPVSYLIEAPRSLLVEGWDGQALLLGVLVAAGTLVSALIMTVGSLRAMSVTR
ncbi:MAG: ABC transporter permease [Actinobacteria bacterium]|nr:ABC transporter permease [Actinomycetota bacterium]